MKFTDKSISALKAKDKRYVLTEAGSYGAGRLQVRVSETGSKTFRVQYHFEGKRKVIGLGAYPTVDLKKARSKHAEITAQLSDGLDPQSIKAEEEKKIENVRALKTFSELLNHFKSYCAANLSENTLLIRNNCIEKDIRPFIESTLMSNEFDVDKARDIIYRVYNRGAKQKALILRSVLLNLLKFAIDFDNSPANYKKPNLYDISNNFIRDINLDVTKNPGERWLTEDELKRVWHTDSLPFYTKQYIKLSVALGGQRISEVYHSNIDEFDLKERIFTIPKSRIKIKKRGDHLVPLTDMAIKIVKELAQVRGSHGQLFPNLWHDEQSAHFATLRYNLKNWCKTEGIDYFAPRDLRRTCKTLMGKAGISKIDRDTLQQHNKGDVSSVHYDRYDYLDEKRASLEKWESYLLSLGLN